MNCNAGNDDVTILNLFIGLMFVVQYDKAGIQVVRKFLISETECQSTRSILLTGESVEYGDHDFSSENLNPSATLRMNLTETPG